VRNEVAILEFARGLGVTFKNLLRPPVTVQYPEERRVLPERTRGRHVLHRYENGLERCIGCYLCAGACPADCIYIEAAENTPENRVSAGERYARVYEIDELRCIFCGLCEEACPTGAITLEPILDLSDYARGPLIYTKEMLLEPARDLDTLPA
jgi:NADH-quinone oxidoreductase subunit I